MIKFSYNKNLINSTIVSLFGIGTIIVCFYLFLGLSISVYFALISYSSAYILLAISYIRNTIVLSSKLERVDEIQIDVSAEKENNHDMINVEALEKERVELKKVIQKEKSIEMTKSIFSCLFAVFTIIVLLLF